LEDGPVRKSIFFGLAVIMGLLLVGVQADVMACGSSNSGSTKMSSTDKVDGAMAGSYTDRPCGAKDNTIKSASTNTENEATTAQFATAEFSVKGMTCGGCENQVKTTLMNIDGVGDVAKVCHVSEHATVSYDPSKVAPADLASAISKLGYTSEYKMASVEEAKDKAVETVKEIKSSEM